MSDGIALSGTMQQLEQLLEISRTLTSTLDLPMLLQKIILVARELTNSQEASILLYDRTSGDLRFQAVADHQRKDLLNVSVPLDSSAAGWVFSNAKPMILHDASKAPRVYRYIDQKLNFHTDSLLAVPLIVKQESIGVLEAVNKQGEGNYTEDDLAILETLAAQASIAIHNAKLLNKLQDANANLKHLDRMKSDFIAIASHELRTPLGLILGHATFLKDMVKDELRDQIEVIIRSALRLKTIVEDLSAIAHKEEGLLRVRRDFFSVSELVEEVVGRYRDKAAEKKISLSFDVPKDDTLRFDGEREKIDVALSNLIQNALTFTDPEGQVGVKADRAGDQIKVFVVDTGIGIPTEDIERIFDRFYQVESHLTRKHGGMGLGLSITRAMVELHGGEIWCESKEGTGSLFCFTLPLERQARSGPDKFLGADTEPTSQP